MIRWLKYYPLKLRSPDRKRESFAGPEFKSARQVSVTFEGTQISLQAPRHRTIEKSFNSVYWKEATDQSISFRPLTNVATKDWERANLIARRWSYLYPWFGGGASEISFYISIYKHSEDRESHNTNFLHPRGFENAVCHILDNEFGFRKNSHGPLFRGPLDWHRRSDLPISAVEFWIKGNNDYCFLTFPVTDEHIATIIFRFMSHDKQMQEQGDPLIRQILNTVEVTLSPETQEKWDKFKANNPNIQVSEPFAPLKWPIDPEQIGKPLPLNNTDIKPGTANEQMTSRSEPLKLQ